VRGATNSRAEGRAELLASTDESLNQPYGAEALLGVEQQVLGLGH